MLATAAVLQRLHGARVAVLPVDGDRLVDPAALTRDAAKDTVLVPVMAANNEAGALQPIGELADLAHWHGALFHTDAAQPQLDHTTSEMRQKGNGREQPLARQTATNLVYA